VNLSKSRGIARRTQTPWRKTRLWRQNLESPSRGGSRLGGIVPRSDAWREAEKKRDLRAIISGAKQPIRTHLQDPGLTPRWENEHTVGISGNLWKKHREPATVQRFKREKGKRSRKGSPCPTVELCLGQFVGRERGHTNSRGRAGSSHKLETKRGEKCEEHMDNGVAYRKGS